MNMMSLLYLIHDPRSFAISGKNGVTTIMQLAARAMNSLNLSVKAAVCGGVVLSLSADAIKSALEG
jgi:UDP-N-acetylmuramoylalanine-D-glutamate ligase